MPSTAATLDRTERLEAARQDTRERILIEAERLFKHYGYSKTTVADIAQALSMSSANVYRFFGSKSELIEAIADRMLGAKEAGAREVARLPLPASDRLRLMIRAGHQNTVETMIGETKVHEMVVVAMDEQWDIIQAHIARMTDVIATVIAEGMEAGEFRKGDAHLAARCFHQSIIALVHPQLVFQCGRDKTNYVSVDPMVDFALTALKA